MKRPLLSLALLLASTLSFGAPGAHGPNGEHLDAPAGNAAAAVSDVPRLEATTESFEVLARLYDDELSVMIDRFDTNEPVMSGKVEAETNGLKAAGQFHADHGDYSFTDPAFLKALKQPGQHSVIFTVLTEKESDLVEGVMTTAAATAASAAEDAHGHDHDDDHGHAHSTTWKTAVAVIAGALLLGGIGWWRSRRATSSTT